MGAIIFGFLATRVARYSNEYGVLLEEIVSTKLSFRALGVGGWFEAVLSGVAANWLVGMAAFFATMGRTIFASTYRSFWP